ncbi:MAG: hypothetical protein E6H71_03550 [Betaproteobacteria bacterium]|nr:MAG: hypothetical protein E6H71_03550 [Betaproteobacteria bacterium]
MPDVDFERAVTLGVTRCFDNSGQSCVSPTRGKRPRMGRVRRETSSSRSKGSLDTGRHKA